MFRLVFAALALTLVGPLSACSQNDQSSRSTRRAIAQSQAIASDFLQTELALSPETASQLGMERLLGPSASYALDNHSQAGFERRRLVRIELLQRLRGRPRLPDDHELVNDLAIAEQALLDLISLEQLGYGRFNYKTMRPYAIDPYSGIWIEGPNLLAFRQSITSADQATAYASRLKSLTEALEDTRRRLIADRTAGIRIPSALAAETRRRIALLSAADPNALNEVADTFAALTMTVEDLEPADREKLVSMVDREVDENLRSAYERLLEALVQSADETTERLGIWAQPRGQELFVGILKASTGEALSIERLHQRHLQDAMDRRQFLQTQLVLPALEDRSEATPPAVLAERLSWFEAATAIIPPLAAPETTINPLAPEYLARFAPKSVWSRISQRADFTAQSEVLVEFEALWQSQPYLAWRTAADSEVQPLRTLVSYPAIIDAWRLYIWTARDLPVVETASMATVSASTIGLIQASLAVIDTGIHLERWNLAEATGYIQENTGLGAELAEQLALTVAARPGYHSATLAALHRFEALSERAKAVLGPRYSETEFQRALIQNGPRPLAMIERDIEAWYGERLAN